MAATGSLGSTVISTFVGDDTAISLRSPGSADGDIWHLLRFGTADTDRLDIYFPEADLRRLLAAIGQHLDGGASDA